MILGRPQSSSRGGRADDQPLLRDRDSFVLRRPRTAHFHAVYGGEEAVITIADGSVLRGLIRERALRLVREWTQLHREELLDDWGRAEQPNPLLPIDPLP
jgi:hypothetical protein